MRSKAPPARNDHITDLYAREVLEGRVLAGKYHRLACARHVRDRACESTPAFPYRFDPRLADRFYRFAEKLRHYKGEWAGQLIRLQPYQKFRLGSIFGWVHIETELRRFRTAYNEIPRKQGKSLEAAIVATYVTFFDGEAGGEGYCVATKRDQAKIVFNDAKKLVEFSGLRHRITVLAANMHRDALAQKLEPLGADKDSTDGLNPNLIIVDEFHAQKDRGLIDVMETATGARRQPLNFQITTAGDDAQSPCGEQHDYACKILDEVLVDDTFFAFIAHADPADLDGDAWLSETTWRKANPNYGISVKPADLRALATKAQHMPSAAAAFQQKRLNVWVHTTAPWLSMEAWRRGQTAWTPDSLAGRRCWLGIDMSSKIDLTSVVAVFEPDETCVRWRLVGRALTPAETLQTRALRDRAPYAKWTRQRLAGEPIAIEGGRDDGVIVAGNGPTPIADWTVLHANAGNRIDQDLVRNIVLDFDDVYDVQQIGLDPWNAGNLAKDLSDDGFDVIEVPQTLQHMSAPAKDFEADVLDGLIDAGDNPLLLWAASNVVVQRDNKDNIYPTKKRSRGRIDPIIAALLGRKLATMHEDDGPVEDPVLVVA
jgi:phage terminase large subunit-like protein